MLVEVDEGAGIEAVGFGVAAGAGFDEVPHLDEEEAVGGHVWAVEMGHMGFQEDRVGPEASRPTYQWSAWKASQAVKKRCQDEALPLPGLLSGLRQGAR